MGQRVYFIGAGPGDPELLTRKGARLLAECRTVYAFSPFDETFAELLVGKDLYDPYDYPFDALLAQLQQQRQRGAVAFLVPGDLSFFCPFQALIEVLGDNAVVVPGVGTVNAASALLKRTLNLSGTCSRVLIVSPRVLEEQPGSPSLEELAAPGVTLVIYMNHLPLEELVARLRRGYQRNVAIALVHRLGFAGQKVLRGTLDDIVELSVGQGLCLGAGSRRSDLTLVLVGETPVGAGEHAWWDRRYQRQQGSER
ncbi:MAG: SAM-dependent methyltransferase [Syntrophotaleaceae bacterium]